MSSASQPSSENKPSAAEVIHNLDPQPRPVDAIQSLVNTPRTAPQKSLRITMSSKTFERNDMSHIDKIALLEEIIEDLLFQLQMRSIEPTPQMPREKIEESCKEIFQKRIYLGEAGRIWRGLLGRAKTRTNEMVERQQEISTVDAAEAQLRKALDVVNCLQRNFKTKHGDELLASGSRKRKIDEAVEQLEKAAEIVKRMK